MPTYQYACTACEERLEVVQRFTDDPLTECAACGGRLRKVFSPVGIVFKGSGFYRTDSRNGSGSGAGKDAAHEGSGSKDGAAAAASGGDSAKAGDSKAGDSKTGDSKAGAAKAGEPRPDKKAAGKSPAGASSEAA